MILAIGEWKSFFMDGKPVQGTVVRVEEDADTKEPNPTWPYHPAHSVVQYTDADGQTHEIRTLWAADPPFYALGDHPGVIYAKANPTKARIGGGHMFVGAIWTGIASNAFFMIGAFLLAVAGLIERRRARRASQRPRTPPAVLG